MGDGDLEGRLIALVREVGLRGGSRPVSRETSLGPGGLGLDSMGLVELLVAVEKEFGVPLSEESWTGRSDLTVEGILRDLRGVTHRPGPPGGRGIEVGHRVADGATPRGQGAYLLGRLRAGVKQWGLVPGLRWAAGRAAGALAGVVLLRRRLVIIERDLTAPLPQPEAAIPLSFGEADPENITGFEEIWGARVAQRRHLFRERFSQGLTCLVARDGGRIAGYDWLSFGRSTDRHLGLEVAVMPGACYGTDLVEHPAYRGKGVGLALLAQSLRVARRRGCTAQVCLVEERNYPMLLAGLGLLGFRPVGSAVLTRILGLSRTDLELHGVRGVRGRLVIGPRAPHAGLGGDGSG